MPVPTVSGKFGRIVGDDEIRREVLEKLKLWILTYQAEVERQRGWEPRTLEQPASIISTTLLDIQAEDAFPLIAVAVKSAPSQRQASGMVGMEWLAEIAIWASGADADDTEMRVGAHVTAVRALLVQQVGSGPLITNVSGPETNYAIVADEKGRTVGMGGVRIRLGVQDALNDRAQIRTPPVDPYAVPLGLSEVTSVNVTTGLL